MFEVVYRKHLRRCFRCLRALRKPFHPCLRLFLLSNFNRSLYLACTFDVCWLSLVWVW